MSWCSNQDLRTDSIEESVSLVARSASSSIIVVSKAQVADLSAFPIGIVESGGAFHTPSVAVPPSTVVVSRRLCADDTVPIGKSVAWVAGSTGTR